MRRRCPQVIASPTVSILGEDVDALLLSLKTFSEEKGFNALKVKLIEWATASNSTICSHELQGLLTQFTQKALQAQAVTEVEFDSGRAKDLLARLPKPLTEELRANMIEAFPHLLAKALEQARASLVLT